MNEQDDAVVVYPAFASKLLSLRDRGALVHRKSRPITMWRMAAWPPRPVVVPIACDEFPEL